MLFMYWALETAMQTPLRLLNLLYMSIIHAFGMSQVELLQGKIVGPATLLKRFYFSAVGVAFDSLFYVIAQVRRGVAWRVEGG